MLKNCITSNLVLQIKDNLKSGYQSKLPYYMQYSLDRAIREVRHFKMSKWSLGNVRPNNFYINYFAVQMKKCIYIILLGVGKNLR